MHKYSTEQRKGFIQGWKTSGKTIAAFCEEKALSRNTFQNWLKCDKKEQPGAGFVEINGLPQPLIAMNEVSLEIGKLKITLSGEKRIGELEALIRILWALEC